MEREEVLKNYICMKYKSVRQFAIDKNLKYSTIAGLLSHSLGKANLDTVFEICKALNISADALIENGIIVEKPSEDHYSRQLKRLEAYAFYLSNLAKSQDFTIDDIPLSQEEGKIFDAGFETLIDVIRKYRENSEKETKE